MKESFGGRLFTGLKGNEKTRIDCYKDAMCCLMCTYECTYECSLAINQKRVFKRKQANLSTLKETHMNTQRTHQVASKRI